MLTDLARALAARGFDVHVVCSRQLYDDPDAMLPPRETCAGVVVHRVATTRCGRTRLFGRAVDYASFYLSAIWALLAILRRGDVLICKTDPPLMSVPAAFIAAWRRAVLVNWQQDVFPEVASHLGANPLPRALDDLLRRMRDWSLRRAKVNVLIGSRMVDYFAARGIPPASLRLIENWADAMAITPKPVAASSLRARLGLADKFIVGYSGNLGRAHEFETLLAAAEVLGSDPSIVFVMIGGGAKMGPLRLAVGERGLRNFRFLPYQPREDLEDSLAAADAHLVSLLPALEGLIMPSKLYGILAAGRAVIFIGDPDGDIARVIRETECGITVGVHAGTDLAQGIRLLQSAPGKCAAMGLRARQSLEQRYSLDYAVERWVSVLEPEPHR